MVFIEDIDELRNKVAIAGIACPFCGSTGFHVYCITGSGAITGVEAEIIAAILRLALQQESK
jgi:hypothetical protein